MHKSIEKQADKFRTDFPYINGDLFYIQDGQPVVEQWEDDLPELEPAYRLAEMLKLQAV